MADKLAGTIERFIEYRGTVLGIIHALYKEAGRPHFQLRDITRDTLIKCYFEQNLYDAVVLAQ